MNRPLLRLALCFFLSSFALRPFSFAAESPLYIPFQGQVTNQAGDPAATGQYSVIFNLYDQAVGGQPVWSERHVKIGVTKGMINVFLGSIAPLTTVDFSQTKYLGITVDVDNLATTADPEMVPRSLIMPAFHAKKADNATKLNGVDWSAFFVNNDNSVSNDPQTGYINGNRIAMNSVSAEKIPSNAISRDKLAAVVSQSLVPAGTILPYAGSLPPDGFFLCDGRAFSRSAYPGLFSAIGTSWGAPSSAEFNIPDLRGQFLRGVDGPDGGVADRDPDSSARVASAIGGASGNSVGSAQTDSFKSHNHANSTFAHPSHQHWVPGGSSQGGATIWTSNPDKWGSRVVNDGGSLVESSATFYSSSGPRRESATSPATTIQNPATAVVTSDGGSETRPRNAYVNYIIKF